MKSVDKGSRHIKTKYFFVNEKVQNDELKIVYCPTKNMIGDFFTKPLQGTLFITHRDASLGIKAENYLLYLKQYIEFTQQRKLADNDESPFSQQECVGDRL